jgi:hypothetical protein
VGFAHIGFTLGFCKFLQGQRNIVGPSKSRNSVEWGF